MSPCCVPISQHATYEQDQTHTMSDRLAALNRTIHTACQTDIHFRTEPNAQCARHTCPEMCLKTMNCTVGEWFCPRCRSELELDSSNEPMHSSLVPTRLMKQEDCYRSLAAALGMPPAQSDCCHMFRPLCHLQSQLAMHNNSSAMRHAKWTYQTVSAVLY